MPLDVGALQTWIAVRVEQTFLGDERGALAVDVDGAAFVHQRCAITIETFALEHLARDEIVLVPGEVQSATQAAPGIETPVDAAHLTSAADDAGRADIAHPCIIV